DVASRSVAHMVAGVGARPWGVAVSRDGETLYTANGSSGDVSVIGLPSRKIRGRIRVGGSPWGVAVAQKPSRLPRDPSRLRREASPTRTTRDEPATRSRSKSISGAVTRQREPTSSGEALPCRAQAFVDRSETLVPLAIRVPGAAAVRRGCSARVVAAEQLHLRQ